MIERAPSLRIKQVGPFEVEPNTDFIANPYCQSFSRPQADDRTVDCESDLKLTSHPFECLNCGEQVLLIVRCS